MKLITWFLFSDLPVGVKIMLASIGVGGLSAAPLLLYAVFGPADGNPIGLGLLFVLGMLLAHAGVAIGVLWLIVERLIRRNST